MKPGTTSRHEPKRRRTPHYEQVASDRYTAKDRPCARCGADFTTTPKRRMLCERCWRLAS